MSREPYRIEYTIDAEADLLWLTARQSTTVLDTVARQLAYEPTTATRNRKVLQANDVAPWELRVGNLRVYYDVADSPHRIVTVRAVGVKDRDRVRIRGEEKKL